MQFPSDKFYLDEDLIFPYAASAGTNRFRFARDSSQLKVHLAIFNPRRAKRKRR
ncbi:hypothetical protein KP1_14 [Klebsiella virus 2019KP1]|nr:hypothetical protein KP1_14 [Klebsiella virus 2019KP1]